VDIEKYTYNLNPEKIEAAISRKTKAIIPVSLYGQPANFKAINLIANKYDLPVIEDGAQSFGSKHYDTRSCGLSTIGVTSFFPSKPLGGYGDAGACFTDNDSLANSMRQISLHGQDKRYSHHKIGLNGRLDTIQAAILLSKLRIFDREVLLREQIGKKYTEKLRLKGFNETPFIEPYNTSVYAQYTIQLESKNEIINYLNKKGIPTAVHYPSLLSEQVALNKKENFLHKVLDRKIYKSKKLENAKNIVNKVLSLPMHPLLKEDDQDLIVDSLTDALKL